jgi:hypothetical protein
MRRLVELLAVAATVMGLVVLLQLAPVPVEGQAPAATATAGTAARANVPLKTEWGHPNLEGIWLDVYDTPLERAPEHANKEFFTDAERAARDAERSANIGRNRRVARGSQQDVAGAYNAVFTSAKPTGTRTSLVVDPPNGQIPKLTPEAERRNQIDREFRLMLLQATDTCKQGARACAGGKYASVSPRRHDVAPEYNTQRMNRHDGPEDQSLGDRCMSGTTPDLNGHRRVVQGPDSIAIAIDTGQGQGYQRVVYMSGSHPPKHIQLRHGDSRGRWEGDTLVVETTNFSPKFPFRGSGANRKLTERWRRVDADTMEYRVTIEDPTVWTAPWTVAQTLKRQSDEQNRIYYEPRCHEGNFGLPALLIGARVDEKAFEEGKGPDPFTQDTATDFGPGAN